MLLKGFRFGMVLQLAIGPVCLFIFQMANLNGFLIAEAGVLGVVLVDGIFILAAILGLGPMLGRGRVKLGLKIFGVGVLFIFGLSMLLSPFHINILPRFGIQGESASSNIFFTAGLLTLSNPLTILFWAGVFSTKMVEESIVRRNLFPFGLGAVLSTLFFLTSIALVGSMTQSFLPNSLIQVLNSGVGVLLIYFSIRMARKPVS